MRAYIGTLRQDLDAILDADSDGENDDDNVPARSTEELLTLLQQATAQLRKLESTPGSQPINLEETDDDDEEKQMIDTDIAMSGQQTTTNTTTSTHPTSTTSNTNITNSDLQTEWNALGATNFAKLKTWSRQLNAWTNAQFEAAPMSKRVASAREGVRQQSEPIVSTRAPALLRASDVDYLVQQDNDDDYDARQRRLANTLNRPLATMDDFLVMNPDPLNLRNTEETEWPFADTTIDWLFVHAQLCLPEHFMKDVDHWHQKDSWRLRRALYNVVYNRCSELLENIENDAIELATRCAAAFDSRLEANQTLTDEQKRAYLSTHTQV